MLSDLRYALRQMRRAPLFTATIVLVLSLAIGVNAVVMSYVRALATVPAPGVAPSSALVTVDATNRRSNTEPPIARVSYANFARLKDRLPVYSRMAAYDVSRAPADLSGYVRTVSITGVTNEYFDVLGLRPQAGTFFPRFDDHAPLTDPIAVISDRMWRAEFLKDAGVIGRRVRIRDAFFTIVGVAPRRFNGVPMGRPIDTDVWVPLAALAAAQPADTARVWQTMRDSTPVYAILATLAPRVSVQSAQTATEAVVKQTLVGPDMPMTALSAVVGPTRLDRHPSGNNLRTFTWTGAAATLAFLVLLIASANVSALLLGRSLTRRHEIAVRLSLGARRGRVVRQLLIESGVLACCAAGGALLMLWWVRGLTSTATIVGLTIELAYDWQMIGLLLLAAFVTATLFGLSPALHATRASIADAMKGAAATGSRNSRRRQRAMIVSQLAVTQPLLLVTAIVIGRAQAERTHDGGYQSPDRLLVVLPDEGTQHHDRAHRSAVWHQIIDGLGALPGVERMAQASGLPLTGAWTGGAVYRLATENGVTVPSVFFGDPEVMFVGPGFFETVGLPIINGRGFTADDAGDRTRSIVLPENLARAFWPSEDPIGKTLVNTNSPYRFTVVGITRAQSGSHPSAYVAASRAGFESLEAHDNVIVLRTRGPANAMISAVRQVIAAIDPQLPFRELRPADDAMRDRAALQGSLALGASTCAVFALVLAGMGLAGIVMFSVGQRTREIGVRVALGAQRGQIIHMFVGEGMRTVLKGCAVGLPFSVLVFIGAGRLYPSTVSTNPLSAIGALAMLGAVACVATWIPARRAANVDPVHALRAE